MNSSPTLSTAHETDLHGTSAHPWVEWGVTLFSLWFVTGLYLDGWAHAHTLVDSFFTLWHAVIYSGFLGAACVLLGTSLLALLLLGGVWWPIHLWAGGIVLAGITGWLISYLIVLPRTPEISHEVGVQREVQP